MDGTATARELKTRFEVATPADDEAIRRLLRENPMRGAVSVSFEREPDYFRGANIAGGQDRTIVVKEAGKVICMGRCIRRECWLNGRPHDVGYLAELRLDASARGRFGIIRDGFRFFHEKERDYPASFYFTSIAADNERARRLLENGARGLPEYSFLGELDTLLIAVPKRPSAPQLRVERMTEEQIPDAMLLLSQHGREYSLGAVWTAKRLRDLAAHGLPLEQCYIVRDGDEIVAFGALWDQRRFRQTVVRGYSRPVSLSRPLLNLASRVFGSVRLPDVGETLPQVFLSPFIFGPSLPLFIEALFPHVAALGAEYLTVALPRFDPSAEALRRSFTTRTWRSRLYRVSWHGQPAVEITGPILPDVGLL